MYLHLWYLEYGWYIIREGYLVSRDIWQDINYCGTIRACTHIHIVKNRRKQTILNSCSYEYFSWFLFFYVIHCFGLFQNWFQNLKWKWYNFDYYQGYIHTLMYLEAKWQLEISQTMHILPACFFLLFRCGVAISSTGQVIFGGPLKTRLFGV